MPPSSFSVFFVILCPLCLCMGSQHTVLCVCGAPMMLQHNARFSLVRFSETQHNKTPPNLTLPTPRRRPGQGCHRVGQTDPRQLCRQEGGSVAAVCDAELEAGRGVAAGV